ncbi:multicopper oxidase family protein [Candidatus Kaiserbacteria bacterium]|nr:multicopper oxidase family protein [Candidatus Kaiserbacteria bacterium]
MKYVTIFIVSILLIGVGWYSGNHDVSISRHMDMMSGEREGKGADLTKLGDHEVDPIKPTEIVELKDGDTYDMEATIVSQEVGNRTVKRLAYNGQIPGPVLKVQKGAKVTINFTNKIDMETALHSHGLRGDWRMDGAVPITPSIPVGESFSYELEFPDTGVFWYHPHVREDYQQEMGLYGNFVVEEDGYWNQVDQEEYLIVDDILEDGDFVEGVVTNTLMGRFGDTLLINDKEDYSLTVKAGEITRAFITNVANTRTFQLEFEGAEMKLVGGDIGRIEQEKMIEHQIIAPAERYVIELYYDTPGIYAIEHRGKTIGTVTVEASQANRRADFMKLRRNEADYADLRSGIDALLTKKPDKSLRLDIKMKGMMGEMMKDMSGGGTGMGMMGDAADDSMMREHCKMMPQMSGCESYLEDAGEDSDEHGEDGIEWEDDMAMMNRMSTDENIEWVIEEVDTGLSNHQINWTFEKGDMVKVRIHNDENGMHPMQHPIHFHGQRFVVLAENGEVNENMQWKDTVLIPKGQTFDILVDMSNPGKWMAHCHIAEHLHSGMMFDFEVK